MIKILAAITLILLLLTLCCGFIIHFGGESFKNAIKGHMVLGILTLILAVVLIVTIFTLKQ